MKKKILTKIILASTVISVVLALSACTFKKGAGTRMELIEKGMSYNIIRDKETGVLYIGVKYYTPMVDAEGNVIVLLDEEE